MKKIKIISAAGLCFFVNIAFACNSASKAYVDTHVSDSQTYLLTIINNYITNIQNQIN